MIRLQALTRVNKSNHCFPSQILIPRMAALGSTVPVWFTFPPVIERSVLVEYCRTVMVIERHLLQDIAVASA